MHYRIDKAVRIVYSMLQVFVIITLCAHHDIMV